VKTKTILLVEDNPDDVKLTRHAFDKCHIANNVVVVSNGADALDYLFATGIHAGRDLSDQPAVVLLDLKLPKIDGVEVLRRMRADERTRLLPVVVLTSSSEQQDLVRSYANGANSYVRKPVDFDEFTEATLKLGLYWLLLNEPPPEGKRTQ
jgi:two-component system response regulator